MLCSVGLCPGLPTEMPTDPGFIYPWPRCNVMQGDVGNAQPLNSCAHYCATSLSLTWATLSHTTREHTVAPRLQVRRAQRSATHAAITPLCHVCHASKPNVDAAQPLNPQPHHYATYATLPSLTWTQRNHSIHNRTIVPYFPATHCLSQPAYIVLSRGS